MRHEIKNSNRYMIIKRIVAIYYTQYRYRKIYNNSSNVIQYILSVCTSILKFIGNDNFAPWPHIYIVVIGV